MEASRYSFNKESGFVLLPQHGWLRAIIRASCWLWLDLHGGFALFLQQGERLRAAPTTRMASCYNSRFVLVVVKSPWRLRAIPSTRRAASCCSHNTDGFVL